MAYNSKGKTYTDHPLMDEICYACKTILKSIVIKNDVLANNSETKNSLQNGELYIIKTERGYITFEEFPFTYEILNGYGYDYEHCVIYLNNKYDIPKTERAGLTAYANDWFDENFEEQNNYYRSLMGLPPFDTGDLYYIPYNDEYGGKKGYGNLIPERYKDSIEKDIYLHEQSYQALSILYYFGVIDTVRKMYPGSNYSYIEHMGPNSIDLYKARKAAKWDILFIPSTNKLINDRFIDLYKVNRDIYVNKSYQMFFSESGEYYDQNMILIVLAQTFADLVTDTPEWYIRRDIFDIRSCEYFLQASGVQFFKEIPLKYQIRIVKNLNTLIKYKSSNKNFDDILSIFSVNNTFINRYWLHKQFDENGKNPSLQFISSDVNESYDNYIKDEIYRTPYDDITLQDKYWDGEKKHSVVYDDILKKQFTIQSTKYMSIEYVLPLEDFIYTMCYGLGMILDTNVYKGLDKVKVSIPTIDQFAYFSLPDLFLALEIISICFYSTKTQSKDITETKIKFIKTTNYSAPEIKNEDPRIMDWKVKWFPDICAKRDKLVYKFASNNPERSRANLIKVLKEGRHSHHSTRFGLPEQENGPIQTDEEYKDTRAEDWIREIGVYDYIYPDESIDTIERFKEVYDQNTQIYKNLKEMIRDSENQDDKKYLEYVFRELFTGPQNSYIKDQEGPPEVYTDLRDVLKDRDIILYDAIESILSETNIDARKDQFRDILNDIIETLQYYLSGSGLELLYSFAVTESPDAIVDYIYKMICFFKSYKVYFLDPYYSFKARDSIENSASIIDVVKEWNEKLWKWDKFFQEDTIAGINEEMHFEENELDLYQYEYMDIFEHYDQDPLFDYNIDGLNASKDESDSTDINGGTQDPSSQLPYLMFNGGASYLNMIDFSDFNGDDAIDEYEEYYSIDGGEAYNHDEVYSSGNNKNFNYMVDGGCADGRDFRSRTMHFKLVGTELSADVIMADRNPDTVEIKEDGLYVSSNNFASRNEFDYLVDDINAESDKFNGYWDEITYYSDVLKNPNYRYDVEMEAIHKIIKNMEYVIDMNTDNKYVNIMQAYANDMASKMANDLKPYSNPYTWQDLY